jgi:peptidoglycan hydrolase CwlO-like protein
MEDFEKRLKARTAKVHEKIKDLDEKVSKTLGEMKELTKKFEKFAEEHHQEKAKKIKKILE